MTWDYDIEPTQLAIDMWFAEIEYQSPMESEERRAERYAAYLTRDSLYYELRDYNIYRQKRRRFYDVAKKYWGVDLESEDSK